MKTINRDGITYTITSDYGHVGDENYVYADLLDYLEGNIVSDYEEAKEEIESLREELWDTRNDKDNYFEERNELFEVIEEIKSLLQEKDYLLENVEKAIALATEVVGD